MSSVALRSTANEVRPPVLGATRLPGARLQDHHRSAVDLVATAMELRPQLRPGTLAAAAALADSVVELVDEIVGHDLSSYRDLFSKSAHFGGLLAVAEEHQVRTTPGRVAPHAAELLACVSAEFDESDPLAEQLCRWLLESGYFLVRSGTPTQPLVESLRVQITRLLALVEEPLPTARVPRQATSPESAPTEASAATC